MKTKSFDSGVSAWTQPFQGWFVSASLPRVARGEQPWAGGLNPVGIGWMLVVLTTLLPFGLMGAEEHLEAKAPAGTVVANAADTSVSATGNIEPNDRPDKDLISYRRDLPYLGVATTEASEALSAQLGVRAGVGLVVSHLAPDSQAAKAGLQKNDVLTQIDDQSLVHPAQLRKLIQVHKAGDAIRIVFYRSGKQETASVTLGKARSTSLPEERALNRKLEDIDRSSEDHDLDDIIHDSLENPHGDRKVLHQEIHRRMEEVRAAIKEALRDVTDVASDLDPVRNILRDLNRSGVRMDRNATVTVRSAGNGVKSVVKADESGTIVIVQNPKIHLTAHDKEGRLLFDGEIETADQRDKVPREVWERVGPLLEKLEH